MIVTITSHRCTVWSINVQFGVIKLVSMVTLRWILSFFFSSNKWTMRHSGDWLLPLAQLWTSKSFCTHNTYYKCIVYYLYEFIKRAAPLIRPCHIIKPSIFDADTATPERFSGDKQGFRRARCIDSLLGKTTGVLLIHTECIIEIRTLLYH